jgi:PAS domain S-box-containing protein
VSQPKSTNLSDMRAQMLNQLLWVIVTVGFIPMALGVANEIKYGRNNLAMVYATAFILVVILTMVRSFGFVFRAVFCLSLFYGLAVSEFYFYGVTVMCFGFLYTMVVFTGVFFGLRIGAVSVLLSALSVFVRRVLDYPVRLERTGEKADWFGESLSWGVEALAFAFLMIIGIVATTRMVRNLVNSLDESRRLVDDLQKEVAARTVAEHALSASEARYRILAEHGSEVIWETDPDGKCIYIAPSIEEVFGWSEEEIQGDWLFEHLLREKSWPAIKARVAGLVDGEVDEAILTERFLNRDGDLVWCELRMMPICDDAGKATSIQGVIKDISSRKVLEDQLVQSRKLEAIGQLAGGIAHDFNNMLTGIMGSTEMLKQEKELTATAKESVSVVEECTERGAGLVRNLLDFARKSMGEITDIDVHEVMGTVERILERTIGKNINVQFKRDALNSFIRGDANQLENAFLNLCLNSRDAMPQGGALTVTSNVDDNGKRIIVTVRDTGVGVDSSDLDNIFDPFYTTKIKGEGTGLGLSSVKACVEAHEGTIEVYSSTAGDGTEFQISLPLAN